MVYFLMAINGIILVFIVVPLLLTWISVRQGSDFGFGDDGDIEGYLKTHPPISDEEFVRLCGPEVTAEVALKVRSIIAEISCVEESQIYPEARFVKDLGLG